jgi:hypothetical protein
MALSEGALALLENRRGIYIDVTYAIGIRVVSGVSDRMHVFRGQ